MILSGGSQARSTAIDSRSIPVVVHRFKSGPPHRKKNPVLDLLLSTFQILSKSAKIMSLQAKLNYNDRDKFDIIF